MPEFSVVSLDNSRKAAIEGIRQEAREEGKRAASRHYSESMNQVHSHRARAHKEWAFEGGVTTLLIFGLLYFHVLARLHDIFLVSIGATATFMVFHLYKWDWHRSQYREDIRP